MTNARECECEAPDFSGASCIYHDLRYNSREAKLTGMVEYAIMASGPSIVQREVSMKKCSHCKILKDFSEFSKCKSGKLGLHNHCTLCKKTLKRIWYINNREKEIKKSCEYAKSEKGITLRLARYQKNKSKLCERQRKRRAKPHCRKLANIARNKKYRTDINFRVSVSLRARIRKALKNSWKSKPTTKLLGCTVDEFKKYMESKFLPEMTWGNYGYRGWHIDHVIPCIKFDLSKLEEQEKCFHYTNTQPLWWKDNIKKWCK